MVVQNQKAIALNIEAIAKMNVNLHKMEMNIREFIAAQRALQQHTQQDNQRR